MSKTLDEQIRAAQDQLDVLKRQQLKQQLDLEQAELKEAIDFAEFLHDRFCKSNHCDACSWGYETDYGKERSLADKWVGCYSAHERWLNRARNALNRIRSNKNYKDLTILEIKEKITNAINLMANNDDVLCLFNMVRTVPEY